MFYRYQPRFFDAFLRAMTEPPPTPYPALMRWARRTRDLVHAVYAAANAQGSHEDERRALILHLDKRDISMETILTTVRYHAAHEYPYLLGQESEQNVLAVQALNLNDRYLVLRLTQSDAARSSPLRDRLAALRDHLDGMPSVD
jgi:hypothetical protein